MSRSFESLQRGAQAQLTEIEPIVRAALASGDAVRINRVIAERRRRLDRLHTIQREMAR